MIPKGENVYVISCSNNNNKSRNRDVTNVPESFAVMHRLGRIVLVLLIFGRGLGWKRLEWLKPLQKSSENLQVLNSRTFSIILISSSMCLQSFCIENSLMGIESVNAASNMLARRITGESKNPFNFEVPDDLKEAPKLVKTHQFEIFLKSDKNKGLNVGLTVSSAQLSRLSTHIYRLPLLADRSGEN